MNLNNLLDKEITSVPTKHLKRILEGSEKLLEGMKIIAAEIEAVDGGDGAGDANESIGEFSVLMEQLKSLIAERGEA